MNDVRKQFKQWGSDGLLGHAIPKAWGGQGNGFQQLIDAHESLGKTSGDTGLALALNAHIWGSLFPILTHGTEFQRQTWLPGLVKGEIIAGHAITEPQAGSDLSGLQTTAVEQADGYQLTGHKRWITNTPYADLLIIYAYMDNGLSAFLVQRDDPGVQFLAEPTVEACHNAGMGDIILDNCRIDKNRLLGSPGNGQLLVQHALELERAFTFASVCGILEQQLKLVIDFSRQRKIQGKSLALKQSIAHRIAEMRLRLDTLRLWVEHCAKAKDAGRHLTMQSSQTKLYGAEAFLQSSLDTVQIMGSAGMETNQITNRWVQDAMASRLLAGSSEVQKNIIAVMLGVA